MRSTIFAALLLVTLAGSAPAQTIGVVKPAVLFEVVPPPRVLTAAAASATVDDMVTRLMSFDRNADGTLTADELLERMDSLVARGDANRDGALDAAEIRKLIAGARGQNAVRGFEAGRYGFLDDQSEESSRLRIDGALADLMLASPAKEQAADVVKSFIKHRADDAAAALIKELTGVLPPDQVTRLKTALNDGGEVRLAGGGSQVLLHVRSSNRTIAQIHVPMTDMPRVVQAVNDYRRTISLEEPGRVALVEQMRGILTDEQRDDFIAALARRPIVKTGGTAGSVLGGTLGLSRLTPQQALPADRGTAAERRLDMMKSALDDLLKARQQRESTASPR